MKKILIIAGGLQQLQAIRSVRNLHWHSVVLDKNPQAIGRYEADEFFMIDIKDREAVGKFAESYHEENALSGVCTVGTDFSHTVAYVAEKLSLPSIPLASAMVLTDKGKMRTDLRKGGVTMPDFIILDASKRAEAVKQGSDFIRNNPPPYVLKPARSMGGRGVQYIEKLEEWEEKLDYTCSFSDEHTIVLERFIDGQEYSVDAIVRNGHVSLAGIADRHIALRPFFVELGHSLPSEIATSHVEDIQSMLQRCAKLLHIQHGVLKGDIFIENDQVVIGELAGRLSGGFMSGWTIPLSSGIPLVQEVVRMSAGYPLQQRSLMATRAKHVAERAIISIPGRILSIEGLTESIRDPSCTHIFLSVNQGDEVVLPRNNTEKVGNLIITESTRERCRHVAQNLLQKIEVVLTPSNERTEQFLFSANHHLPSIGPAIRWANTLRSSAPRIRRSQIPVYLRPNMIQSMGVSWSGQGFDEIYQEAFRRRYLRKVSHPSQSLGDLVFQGIQRGGLQALRYLVDTLKVDSPKQAVARWRGYQQ